MMKPYFTHDRNYYPRSNNFACVAHWWRPVVYRVMIGGKGPAQDMTAREVDETSTMCSRHIRGPEEE